MPQKDDSNAGEVGARLNSFKLRHYSRSNDRRSDVSRATMHCNMQKFND
jgi:hypothetical protein